MNRELLTKSENDFDNEIGANKIREKVVALYKADIMKYHTLIQKFAQGLMNKYGIEKCSEYLYYNTVIGSTPRIQIKDFPKNKIDFAGEDSVEKFVSILWEKEFNNPKENENI